MSTFTDLMKKKAGEVERPPILPEGYYRATVQRIEPPKDQGEWQSLDVFWKPLEAMEGVDEDELARFKELPIVRQSFMFNADDEVSQEKAVHNFQNFILNVLFVDGAADKTLEEQIIGAINYQAMIHVTWRKDKQGEDWPQVRKAAPLDTD